MSQNLLEDKILFQLLEKRIKLLLSLFNITHSNHLLMLQVELEFSKLKKLHETL